MLDYVVLGVLGHRKFSWLSSGGPPGPMQLIEEKGSHAAAVPRANGNCQTWKKCS